METLLERISSLNDLILQGKGMDAFEKYYHKDVIMQENNKPPTKGKIDNRKREQEFFNSITEFRFAKPLKTTIGEGITMVEWHFDYTHKDLGIKNHMQISVQEWKEGKIINEKFYYES